MDHRSRTSRRTAAFIWWALSIAYPVFIVIAATRPEFGAETTRAIISRLLPSLSPEQVHSAVVIVRKSAHVVGYALFTMILASAFISLAAPPRRRSAMILFCVLAAIVAVGVAIADETLQTKSPFRSGNARDVGYDVLGIATAMLIRMGLLL